MWYAAHVIMRYHYVDTSTKSLVGYENIVIVDAADPTAAIARARAMAVEDEIRSEGHRLNGRPVHLILEAVKKVVECRLTPGQPRIFSEGNEITYNDLVAASEDDFTAFVRGERASVEVA